VVGFREVQNHADNFVKIFGGVMIMAAEEIKVYSTPT
jgi:hypothetical protein